MSISGNAASATWARYITPRQFGNQGTIGALKSSILSAMGDGNLLMYPGQSYITSGGHVSTIMNNWSNDGFSIPAGSQTVLLRLDNYQSSTYGVFLVSGYNGGFYRLLRNDSSTWKGPYILLDTENYHNIADARYVKKAGDTMTGRLVIDTSVSDLVHIDSSNSVETFIKVFRNGIQKAAFGYYDGRGSFMYNWVGGYYFELTDGGGLQLHKGGTLLGNIWHSGNDGSGSGLDADLLDGVHKSGLLTSLSSNATTNLLLTVGGTTKSISELYAYQAVRLLVNDTRSDNNIPYNNGKGVYADFKYNSTDGWNYGGSYHAVIHINPWNDSSGGLCTQLAFGDDGSVGLRKSSGSSWGSWRRLLDTVNNIFTSGRLFIPSSSGNQVFDAYIA